MAIIGGNGLFPRISELRDIVNVNCPTRTDGDILIWNDTLQLWQCAAPGAGGLTPHNLDFHTDVNAGSPNADDCLCYDGVNWVPQPPSALAPLIGSNLSLSELSDLDIAGASTDDVLTFDGSNWVAQTPSSVGSLISLGDLSDVDLTGIGPGYGLITLDGINWTVVDPTTTQQSIFSIAVLDDLSDVNVGTPTIAEDGFSLVWDNTAGEFVLQNVSGGGGGVTGSGNPTELAFWNTGSDLTSSPNLFWNDVSSRLEIIGTNVNLGALLLNNGPEGALRFESFSGTLMGFWLDQVGGDDAYVWQADEGGSNQVSFVIDQTGSADRVWSFSTSGTGQADVHVEGGLRLFGSNDFASDVPIVNASCILGLPAGAGGAIRWSATSGSGPDLGVWLDDVNSRDAYVWEKNANNGLDFMIDEAGGASRTWRFGTSGTGLCDVAVEGHLEVWDQANFPSNGVATAGTLRFGQDPFIYGRDDSNVNRVIIAYDSTNNRVTFGGVQNSFYPSLNATGFLANDGSGNLSWSPGTTLAGSFDIGDIANVVETTPAVDEILVYDGANWVNSDLASVVSNNILLSDLNDLDAGAPNDDDILQYNNGTGLWEAVAPSVLASTITVEEISNIDAPTPANGETLIFNTGTGNWENGPVPGPATIGSIGNVNDAGVANGGSLVFDGSQYVDKFVVTTSQRTRNLYGRITAAGGIISGSSPGFTVTKLGPGQYRINYNTNFDSNSTCTATASTSAGTIQPKFCECSPAVNNATIFTRRRDTGVTEDQIFSFHAIGLGVA